MAGGLNHVTIVEVGPRDGLQNEPAIVPTTAKIAFIHALADAGLPVIESTSFVNPAAVPQLADAADVMAGIRRRPAVRYPVLVPNERGFERALAAGVDAIALFTAATEAFCQANIRCSIDESFARFEPVARRALASGLWVRGYVSVAFDCPYSGAVASEAPIAVAERLFDLGCHEVSIADTIGSAGADATTRLVKTAEASLPMDRVALHFHDTFGRATENIGVAYDQGVRIFDSAAGGLGGCPFAPGAAGNVATERVVRFFSDLGVPTGIDAGAVERAAAALLQERVHERPTA